MTVKFCLDWLAGPNAQVELFSPSAAALGGLYQLKYTPAFRATIRPPIEERPLGPAELRPINSQLNKLATAIDARSGNTEQPNRVAAVDIPDPFADMAELGTQLLDLMMPPYVQADLRAAELFLEIGMDDKLLEYPWELMHDGDEFLCLKHAIGRFVNGAAQPMIARQPVTQLGSSLDALSILLISVPRPQPRDDGLTYEHLKEAEAETDTIIETISKIEGISLSTLIGKEATWSNVWKTLRGQTFQIIHFNGHATFDEATPRSAGLVLFDRNMLTGSIATFFGRNPPLLCFINACETAKAATWKNRHDIFGLASAFLNTGAYLLGTRWKINDKAAAEFAKRFYTSLIVNHKSIGAAVKDARIATKVAAPDDFAWASYVFYGDPRVCFRRV
ncbi:MAG: CHAT domain-containing protein [Gemmatimonadota bacterium]|nr:CHAT domain-containing protein [Gemmatimonadota bacterium]